MLLYPLVGHLTDVYLTRYRSLKWSFGILILVACLVIVFLVLIIATSSLQNIRNAQTEIGLIILFLVYTIGLGLFQANAIQFGLDQLLEAPTPKLISFIHWYYWAQNVGSLALFYAAAGSTDLLSEVYIFTNGTILVQWYKPKII